MFSRVRLLLTISIGLLVLAACGEPVPPATGFEVAVTVVGDGSVTSEPAGIDTAAGTTAATFSENAEVVLTAVPTGNATFTNWTGGACDASTELTCTIPDLTGDVAVTATFTEDVEPGVDVEYTVNVVNGGAAVGAVSSSSGVVTDCLDSCEDTAAENTTVTLTATATAGGFAGWTGGDCAGVMTLTCDVTLEVEEEAVTANFNDVATETVPLDSHVEELLDGRPANLANYPIGYNYTSSGDLDFGYDPAPANTSDQVVGMRFVMPLAITEGVRIQSAVIDLVADEVQPGAEGELSVIIAGENVNITTNFVQDTPGQPASSDASTRATTTAEVAWTDATAWAETEAKQTPDISPVVQEVVNIEGWAGDVVILVRPANADAAGDPDVDVPGRAAVAGSTSMIVEFVPMPVPPV